jgi:hypothetical protein
MSIVSTTYTVEERGNLREIRYTCTDSEGVAHQYGPVLTVDANFDPGAHATIVAAKVANALAEQEAKEVIG